MTRNKLEEELNSFPKNNRLNEKTKQKMINVIKSEPLEDHREGGHIFMKKTVVALVSVALFAGLTFFLFSEIDFTGDDHASPGETNGQHGERDEINIGTDIDEGSIDDGNNHTSEEETPEPEVERVLTEFEEVFMNVIENSDENGKVTNHESKEDLSEHFTQIMSPQLAEWHVETYFREEEGDVFVIPTDTPLWFDDSKPYDEVKENDETYHVYQIRENEMIGKVEMIYILTVDEGKWIVENIDSEEQS
ncbi:hypothetical protein LGQ02_10945 [Bacillus shivajii]|uniref:hypothetical protein n=1 Tax=Bacillus shivajii TaxID=1983719 RepID=UPI001CFAB8AF|nr:hypothetical protein [Bacillus shivajii]UCZ51401.1 hypothetical protein LGQ02_10945 [Bacillus shivajii]